MTDKTAEGTGGRSTAVLAMAGFIAVAVAQVTNMILARANAGEIPPFSLACVRWAIVAAGLAPFAFNEMKSQCAQIWPQRWPILAAGFLGMFLCGGPVYIAGVTTTAINIALIIIVADRRARGLLADGIGNHRSRSPAGRRAGARRRAACDPAR